jgi:hypothetical protein
MDAASYAAQRQQMDAAKLQQLMQMFMAAKQNQQDQGWQREQFAYRQQQDAADNARSSEYYKGRADYEKASLGLQERAQRRLEAKDKEDEKDRKFSRSLDIGTKMGVFGEREPTLDEVANREFTIYNARARGGGTGPYAPKDEKQDPVANFIRGKEFEIDDWAIGETARIEEEFDQQISDRPEDEEALSGKRDKTLKRIDAAREARKDALYKSAGRTRQKAPSGFVTADGKPVPDGAKFGTDKKTGKRVAKINGETVEVFPAK